MSASAGKFQGDESGAAILEMTATIGVFLLILGGIVDFSYLYYQWNAATKATQHGARLAAVSNPVASGLMALTGVSGGVLPGDPMPAFDCTCNGSTASCTGTMPSGACGYDLAAMNTIVFGRSKSACATPTSDRDVGMCNFFSRIARSNVVVQYQYTGLGYAGRPGGPVPTITVRLQNLTYSFVFLQSLLGKTPINLPGLNTTITGEDLKKSQTGS